MPATLANSKSDTRQNSLLSSVPVLVSRARSAAGGCILGVLILLSSCGRDVKSYVEEADILIAQNRMDEAIILYQKAIKEHANNPILYLNQAVLFRERKKFDLALKNYQIAHDLNPKSTLPFIGMGRTMMLQNRFEESLNALQEADALAPENPLALFYLGRVHYELKNGSAAILTLNKSLIAGHKPFEVYYYRGRVYEDLYKDSAHAVSEYVNYLKSNGPRADEVKLRMANLQNSMSSQ